MELLHRLSHWLGLSFSGHVVSSTDAAGNVWIAYECDTCAHTIGKHVIDVDRHIALTPSNRSDGKGES